MRGVSPRTSHRNDSPVLRRIGNCHDAINVNGNKNERVYRCSYCGVAYKYSSAVAKRPYDASCLSVVSFNTKRRVQSSIIKPPLATARAASCNGPVHLFVCSSVCLSPKYKNAIFSKTKQFRGMASIDYL